MTLKAKFVFGFLAIFALLSVLSFFDTFSPVRLIATAPFANISVLATPETDTDHDGLADTAESYWNTDFQNPDTDGDGFKDGEEVVSGHDPTKSGPDDKIDLEGSPTNITSKIGGLVLSGLYEGSLRKDSPNFSKSVNQVVEGALQQYTVNAGEAAQSSLTTIFDTSENKEVYRNSMRSFLVKIINNVPQGYERMVEAAKTIDGENYREYLAFFDSEKARLASFITELEAMPVPQTFAPFHTKTITYLKKIRRGYELIQEGDDGTDPVQGMIAASSLPDMLTLDLAGIVGEYKNLENLQ